MEVEYSRIRPQPVQVRLQVCRGSSCSTVGAMIRKSASASASATRVHTTDQTAASTGTPARCAISRTRAASPTTATARLFTAAPTRFAA